MSGFFKIEKYQKKAPRKSKIPSCGACKLFRYCDNPKMEPSGQGKKGILIVGESPSRDEDFKGINLTGAGGVLLKRVLRSHGIDLERDCIKTNAIRCRVPKKLKKNSSKYIKYCRPNIEKLIQTYRPKLIFILGSWAAGSVIGSTWAKDVGGINRWRGFIIPDRTFNSFLCPTYHPVYVRREEKNPAVELLFKRDIESALVYLQKDFPEWEDESNLVEVVTDFKTARRKLKQIIKKPPSAIAFDYETTGLKPQERGHKIVTASIAISPEEAFAFPMMKKLEPYFVEILKSKKIKKIAANMKYEELWSRVRLNTPVKALFFDTMLAAHVLDNRKKIASLKFQTYIRYGVPDYDSEIEYYLKSEDKCGNSFNRILEAPLSKLLKYNGLDSLYTFKVALDQMLEMGISDPMKYIKKGKI